MGAPIIFKLGLPSDKQPTNCPLCKNHVMAVTCAFNNCEYRYKSIVDTKNGLDKKGETWKEVNDYYYRFDESNSLKYSSLVIETKIGKNSITREFECGICLSGSENKFQNPNKQIKELPCRHSFHVVCIEPWIRSKNSCPYCRVAIN